MSSIRALLKDRRRSQRGSVLSGVLIMTAFIAILSGALMTSLSTNFLLSNDLVTRAANQATVNSAAELAISQLQATSIGSGCPILSPVTLNGRSAVASYMGCVPVVDSRTSPQLTRIGSSSSYAADGTHSVVSRASQNVYVVGDQAGNVYQYPFGQPTPNWSYSLPGHVAGPPVTLPDFGGGTNELLTLVPLDVEIGGPPACANEGCVAMLVSDVGNSPVGVCYMGANYQLKTSVAQGVNFRTAVFFGDLTGSLFAYAAYEGSGCALLATVSTGSLPVVAGPLVFAGPAGTDEVYVIVSNSSSSSLLRYTYTSGGTGGLTLGASLPLPAANVAGIAVDGSTLPARVAVTFAGGQVAVVQLQSSFAMQLLVTGSVGSSLNSAPYWCHCPGPADQIGVVGANGAFYLLDPSLNLLASLSGGPFSVTTRPAADAVGDWFFGASDGYVHEVQVPPGQSTMMEVARFGSAGAAISSSVQVGSCPSGICIYLGAQNGGAYIVLDARDIVITSCISTSPPSCSGANPRLWANAEIGVAGNPRMVHVLGWSYFSA